MKMAVTIIVSLLVLITGCSKDKGEPHYSAAGEVQSVDKTGITIEGVRTDYLLTLSNLQQENNSSEMDRGNFSITSNTVIYNTTKDEKSKADISAITAGKHVDVVWRFANDHLTEALEIVVK
ncbi:hypothetical protein PCCS19_05480 [Paenibacillus sp. CCS19]|uniref:hypothetical protein n=1 Tax=Paenibacillus sp. CCS19 TaxID=3158387 RepID=UPI00256CBE19|nr:hypothetical protein [Paenibacillus cellulosilyticus]GMK37494.1 hypothetical protein PCCS19_05480 [Paenibacillus cellulosilyticus]